MENIVSNESDLHPLLAKALGIKLKPAASAGLTANVAADPGQSSTAAPTNTSTALVDDDGWEAVPLYRPVPNGAATIRKQLGPHTYATTVVFPGERHYPSEYLANL